MAEFTLELVEEVGKNPNKYVLGSSRIATVTCISVKGVAAVARAIANDYFENQEIDEIGSRHTFSVTAYTYRTTVQQKVVTCYPGMTTYHNGFENKL